MVNNNVPFHLLKFTPSQGEDPLEVTIEVQPEFEAWFLKAHGLAEWDEDKFNSWFKSFLSDAAKDRLTDRLADRKMSEQQQVDVFSREGIDDE